MNAMCSFRVIALVRLDYFGYVLVLSLMGMMDVYGVIDVIKGKCPYFGWLEIVGLVKQQW